MADGVAATGLFDCCDAWVKTVVELAAVDDHIVAVVKTGGVPIDPPQPGGQHGQFRTG